MKLKSGYYKIKPNKFTHKPTIYTTDKKTKDNDLYTYTTRYYNKIGIESYELHIHKPETIIGKLKSLLFKF